MYDASKAGLHGFDGWPGFDDWQGSAGGDGHPEHLNRGGHHRGRALAVGAGPRHGGERIKLGG